MTSTSDGNAAESGTFGHRVAMLDFNPRELARLRRIGRIVEVTGVGPDVESALAISGSSAQSKIQSFPGDFDYFQRLNIKAPSREEACARMATIMREKVLSTYQGDDHQFMEGKLDWVVTDPERRQLSNASNVIDVTWEAEDAPIFAKVTKFVSDDALDEYVERIEGEVRKYLTDQLNYGKAAKRMYNVFRLSGRHLEAAYVRELFDEPATILYQVWSLISTLDDATQPGSSIPISAVQAQADSLIVDVVSALEGEEEVETVRAILQLRQSLELQDEGERRVAEVEAAQTRVINVVNTFFREKLTGMPTINEYIAGIQGPVAPDAGPEGSGAA